VKTLESRLQCMLVHSLMEDYTSAYQIFNKIVDDL
jgi:hypothetical protein